MRAVGGLGHYLESEGIPTTQISLIREHTVVIQPPRALWVPFELGRPLGVPGDAEFQMRVTFAALELLEAANGPVLVDYPEEAPSAPDTPDVLVCPVNFSAPLKELNDTEALRVALQQEVMLLRPWYDQAQAKRGRTTVGLSGLSPEELGTTIGAFLDHPAPTCLQGDLVPASVLRLAAEDLKAYYAEAIASQPGQESADSQTVANWFWRETTASRVLFSLMEKYQDSADEQLQHVTQNSIIPRHLQAASPFRRA